MSSRARVCLYTHVRCVQTHLVEDRCHSSATVQRHSCGALRSPQSKYYHRTSWLHVSKTARLAAVHHGFQWSWTHNGFSERVLAWVHDFRNQHPHGKIIVTGG